VRARPTGGLFNSICNRWCYMDDSATARLFGWGLSGILIVMLALYAITA
jgi:hypothetical protein